MSESGHIYKLKKALTESNIPFLIDILEFDRLPQSFQEEIEKKHIIVYDGKSPFNDSELFKNGSFDFEYALKWFLSIKDLYDLIDISHDMIDIYNLLNASPEDIATIERKSYELKLKYRPQVETVNFFYSLHNRSNNQKTSPKDQLCWFYFHLPIFALMKAELSKLLQSCVDAYLNQMIEKLTSEFSAMFQQNHATEEEIKKT